MPDERKKKAIQARIDFDIVRLIRDMAIGRAESAEMDEDANPFTSR